MTNVNHVTCTLLDDGFLSRITGVRDFNALNDCLAGKTLVAVGGGDLAFKKVPAFALCKRLGARIFLVDINRAPKALDALAPYIDDFIWLNNQPLHDLGEVDVLDISTWGFTHVPMALRFWDRAKLIVTTKPVDTNLELLRAIRSTPLFEPLRQRLLVHDHYGGRWIVREAASRMPTWHESEGCVRQIQIYILERKSVTQEMDRITALSDGICLDLMPHAIKVIQSLLPVGASWTHQGLTCTREAVRLTITGGAREHSVGCPIEGTVETFAAVSFQGKDVVRIENASVREFPFDCLIVVGKGLVGNEGDDRDTKGVCVKFDTGNCLSLDLETQRAQAPGGELILPPADILHRGINLPLIELMCAGFPTALPEPVAAHFQTFDEAVDAAELIEQSRALNWLGRAYHPGRSVVNMINAIPRAWWGGKGWQLEALPRIAIGDVPKETHVVM